MKIIVANWKMNHDFDKVDEWLDIFFRNFSEKFEQIKNVEIVLCAPSTLLDYIDSELMEDGFKFLEEIAKKDNKKAEDFSAEEINEIVFKSRLIKLGGQDCHYEKEGSFTGDISATMLKSVGCEYVILGHSERRISYLESNELVAKKAIAALDQSLTPIICIGENIETRQQNKHLEFVQKQLIESIPKNIKFKKLVVAYEPIWSIGTGKVPSSNEIFEIAEMIKKNLNENFNELAEEFFLLYGGSVNSKNAAEILAIKNVDGLLVGKASLDAEEIFSIISKSIS